MVACLFNGFVQSYRLSDLSDDELLDVFLGRRGSFLVNNEKRGTKDEAREDADGKLYVIMVDTKSGTACGKMNAPCSPKRPYRNPPYQCCAGSYACLSDKCSAKG